jgi:hypothetical protein
MRTVESAFDQLRRANPVPNPSVLRRELREYADTVQGRTRMQTTTTDSKRSQPIKKRQKWTVGVVAAVLTLALGMASLLLLTDDFPFADSGPTPVEIVEDFMAARDAHDAERARALLADDVAINDAGFREPAELGAAFEMHRQYGFRVSPYDCATTSPPGQEPTVVLCNYSLDSRLQHIVGYPPIEATFAFTVSEGLITRLSDGFPYSRFSPNVYEPFHDFLETEHPGAVDSLFYKRGGTEYPVLTPEALELVPSYLDLYEEWAGRQP